MRREDERKKKDVPLRNEILSPPVYNSVRLNCLNFRSLAFSESGGELSVTDKYLDM